MNANTNASAAAGSAAAIAIHKAFIANSLGATRRLSLRVP